jgi:hypothetical protein
LVIGAVVGCLIWQSALAASPGGSKGGGASSSGQSNNGKGGGSSGGQSSNGKGGGSTGGYGSSKGGNQSGSKLPSGSQSGKSSPNSGSQPGPKGSSGPTPAAQKERAHIEKVTGSTLASLGRPMVVTSRHRDDSPAHQRGAIDISSKSLSTVQRHNEAKTISKNLGSGYTVVVEEVDHKTGKQTNTSYANGQLLNRHTNQPILASETHTHIQPNAKK